MSLLKRLLGGGNAPGAAAREPVLVNAYATLRDLPPLDLPHRVLGARDRSDPELAEHLRGSIPIFALPLRNRGSVDSAWPLLRQLRGRDAGVARYL